MDRSLRFGLRVLLPACAVAACVYAAVEIGAYVVGVMAIWALPVYWAYRYAGSRVVVYGDRIVVENAISRPRTIQMTDVERVEQGGRNGGYICCRDGTKVLAVALQRFSTDPQLEAEIAAAAAAIAT